MNLTSVLMVIAVIAVVVSAGNLIVNLDKTATGKVSEGNVTLEVFERVEINFTREIINWSTGNVDPSAEWAYLNTQGLNINNVSWNNQTRGLVIESLSTLNITLSLTSSKNALNFLDNGQVVAPASQFLWATNNASTDDYSPNQDGEIGTCRTLQLTTYTAVTTAPTTICSNMGFATAANEIEIDIAVNISRNAPTGPKNVTITATAVKI